MTRYKQVATYNSVLLHRTRCESGTVQRVANRTALGLYETRAFRTATNDQTEYVNRDAKSCCEPVPCVYRKLFDRTKGKNLIQVVLLEIVGKRK